MGYPRVPMSFLWPNRGCCFSTVTVHSENVPGHASAGIIQLRNCTLGLSLWLIHWWLWSWVVWLFCSLSNLQFHTWGMPLQVLESLSRTQYLPQINYRRKLICFGCSPRIGYHWFVCLLGLQCLLMSDSQQQGYGCSYEKSWWSYRARWHCRYLPAIMMVLFLLAATMWTSVEPMLPAEFLRSSVGGIG
jgi:hypothetical protein